MTKIFITIIAVTLVIVGIVAMFMLNNKIVTNDVLQFNRQYEIFNNNNLDGGEVATLINKIINNNNMDKENETDDILMEIRIIDEGYDLTVSMEDIYKLGTAKFVELYGAYEFKCTSIEYDKITKRVNKISFENIH